MCHPLSTTTSADSWGLHQVCLWVLWMSSHLLPATDEEFETWDNAPHCWQVLTQEHLLDIWWLLNKVSKDSRIKPKRAYSECGPDSVATVQRGVAWLGWHWLRSQARAMTCGRALVGSAESQLSCGLHTKKEMSCQRKHLWRVSLPMVEPCMRMPLHLVNTLIDIFSTMDNFFITCRHMYSGASSWLHCPSSVHQLRYGCAGLCATLMQMFTFLQLIGKIILYPW